MPKKSVEIADGIPIKKINNVEVQTAFFLLQFSLSIKEDTGTSINEIEEVINGTFDKQNNVLKNAPHTASIVTSSSWVFPYTREKAAYPLDFVSSNKFWPSVGRVDNAHGDRNLFCSCIPLEEYSS